MTIDPRYYQPGGQGYIDPSQFMMPQVPPQQWWTGQAQQPFGNQPGMGNPLAADQFLPNLGAQPAAGGVGGFFGGIGNQFGNYFGGIGDMIGTGIGQVENYLGTMNPWDPSNPGNWLDPADEDGVTDPIYGWKPNVKGPDGNVWVWDPDTQSYKPAAGDPWDPSDPDNWPDPDPDPVPDPNVNPPVIGPGGVTYVWDPDTQSYKPQDPWDPSDISNWQDPPPWWQQFPFPRQRESANWGWPPNPIADMWRKLLEQGMSGDWARNLQDEFRHSQDQQNAFNLRRMIEEAALTRQESRQGWLGPLLEKLITGVGGAAGQALGSGVGPVGAIFRGIGQHSRYVEGGEDEGSGPMTVMNKPREVSQPRRFSGMLPSSTSSRLGAAGEQYAQALGSRGESVRQQTEDAVGRASAGQATQARSQAGQQGLGLSNLVTGMQRQAEALADAKERSKRGVLKPVLQQLMGQV